MESKMIHWLRKDNWRWLKGGPEGPPVVVRGKKLCEGDMALGVLRGKVPEDSTLYFFCQLPIFARSKCVVMIYKLRFYVLSRFHLRCCKILS